MDIVCGCDEKFLQYTASMLCSLFNNNPSPIRIHLLHGDISQKKLKILRKFVKKYHNEFHSYLVDESLLQDLKVDKHASIANYYRLLIPEILPETITKVIYLDSDLIVRKPLEELWNINIDNYYLAAVEDKGFVDFDRLFMPQDSKYFNSGVLLINLSKWRQEKIHLKVINFIHDYPDRIQFWDQDGLNALINGQWKELPTKWNTQHGYFFPTGYDIRYADITSDPAIVHFSGNGLKPWLPNINHKYKAEYLKYESETPFAPKNHTLLTDIKLLLKRFILSFGRKIAHFTPIRHLLKKIFNALNTINNERMEVNINQENFKRDEEIRNQIEQLIPNLVVVDGAFSGLKYSEIKSIGSTIAPKLFGTYEAELNEVVEKICSRNYSTIIDIGCAEGYYAIGLALRNPEAHIFAYDINPEARRLCQSMAKLNGVADRVIVDEFFTMSTLLDLDRSGNGIIFSDCEGAEEYIFYKNQDSWKLLTEKYDLLIEIHEFIRPGISDYIKGLFSKDYVIETIRSIDDIYRPSYFPTPLLQGQTLETQIRLMAEKRPGMMEWLFIKRIQKTD
jgi:lipopolysaccharide biosynthesis glycosyltransferase